MSLEGIRGLAAVVVVLWHNLLGFFPRQSGTFAEFHHSGQRAMPWFGLFNGTAAVTVFFVLSGLVLSRAYLLTGDAAIIGRGAIKRWPRLAGPVILVVMLSAVLDLLGLYRYDQAAALTGSPWLAGHLFHGVDPGSRGLAGAFAQGALTFFRGDSTYDTSLWTMRLEMTGSYLVFGLALILGQVRGSAGSVVYLMGVYVLIYLHLDINMLAFLAGVTIAHAQTSWRFTIPLWAGAASVAVALFLLGYSALDAGWYRPLAATLGGTDKIYVHVLGAAMAIVAVDACPTLRTAFDGRWSAFLGWISFPIYLVHIPILCSLGSATFLTVLAMAGPKVASLSAAIVTVAASVAAAVPLAMVNDAWTGNVDRLARRFSHGAAP